MSDFDEKDIVQEAPSASDFDAADIIADAPETVETSAPSSQGMNSSAGAAIGAGVGYGLGKLGQGAATIIDKGIVPAMGNLDQSQMNFITKNPDTYRNADSLTNLLEQFKGLGQDVSTTAQGAGDHYTNNLRKVTDDVNQASYDKAAFAKKSLEGQAPLPKSDYYKSIGEGLNKTQGALSDISPDAKKEFFQQNYEAPFNAEKEKLKLQEVSKRVDYLNSQAPDMETFKGSSAYDKFQKELAESTKNLLDTQNKIKEQVAKQAIESYRGQSGIPKELLAIHPELADKKLNPVYSKIVDSAVSHARNPLTTLNAPYVGGDAGIIPLLRESANFDGDSAPAEKLATNISESVRGKLGELNPVYDENMKASSRAIDSKEALGKAGVKVGEDGIESLSKSSSDKIKKTIANPDLYPDEQAQLQRAIDSSREFSQNQPLDLAQERYAQASRLEEQLKQLGLKVDKNSNAEITNASQNKLVNLADNVDSPDAQKLSGVLDEAKTISSNPNFKNGADFLNDVKASKIKEVAGTLGNASSSNLRRAIGITGKSGLGAGVGYGAGGTTGAAIGAGAGLAADVYGSKLQELYALQKAGKLGDVLSAGKSALPGILGGLGAIAGGMGAASASTPEDERLNPAVATAATAADIALPVPGVDVVAGAQQGQKEALAVSRGTSPEDRQLQEDVASSGDLGADPSSTMTSSNPVNAAALSGFAKGALSPIPVLGKMGVEALDKGGTERSNDARSRMEQRYANIDNTTPNKVVDGSKGLKQATPDQLMELSQSFKDIKGADNFVVPLENAAQAKSEEERQARLFGLYQQPAFRQLLNKGKKLEDK